MYALYVQMWMSARPSLASVKEETVSTQWDPLNVNAPLGTSSTRSHRNVMVRINLTAITLNCEMYDFQCKLELQSRVDQLF